MDSTVEELASQAISLNPEDRACLADLLLASLPDGSEADVVAAWDEEIRLRVAEVEDGTVELIPAEQVHAELRMLLQR